MNDYPTMADHIRQFLNLELAAKPVPYEVLERVPDAGFKRERIIYPAADGEEIPAFLLIPDGNGPFPAVMVHKRC